jgi:glycosyltransferase involved in cell wall biosynthesis
VSVRYFPTGLGRRFYRSPAMGRALEESCRSFDIIHLHSVFLWPTLKAARIARHSGIPYIVTPHGMLVRELIARKSGMVKSAWISLFERRNIEQASAVQFTSQIEADDLRLLGIKCRRGAVIPNGLEFADTSSVSSVEDLAWVSALPQPLILYFGRVNWKKGLDRLIAAISRIDGLDLVIAGNDEERYQPVLESLAEELGIAHRIKFIGPVTGARKWALLRRAHMLLLPSYSENFGMVVLEAMAVGCPVIVTPDVGLAETVSASEAGLVVKGDPEQLARAIAWLEDNEIIRKKMATAGKKAAADQFSWASVASRIERLYQECTGPVDRDAVPLRP